MLERVYPLTAPDGARITVIRSANAGTGSRKAAILCHGLTGNPAEHIHQTARDALLAAGYDVIRFAFYDDMPNARNIRDCKLLHHVMDFHAVLDSLNGYDKICVAGHSYGGLAILYAQPNVTAISFWDPAFVPSWHKVAKHVPELDCYSVNWNGYTRLLGRPIYEEACGITEAITAPLAAAIIAPSQVILSADDHGRERLYDALTVPKEMHRVEGADHSFVRGDTAKVLARHTVAWFERF
ncbi:MAG: hypothetical protein KGQ41_09475 [Alphaproteobacteria bacterium]|nr:hypothetical protein [Alphaproteobacteria bacterium]